MFGKLFESTYTGSLVGAGIAVHAVWPYVIAHTKHGVVELNPDMLAAQFGGVTPEQVSEAIEYLCSADPRSRNQSEDGRRMIREGAFQYRVVNHEHYRSMRDDSDRREYNRVKKQESRARKSGQTKSQTCQPRSAQPEAEAEAEINPSGKPEDLELASKKLQLNSERRETTNRIFEHWKVACNKPRAKFLPKRREKVIGRLREGYSEAEIKQAIDNCSKSEFNSGSNENGKVYNDLELICRDGVKLEQFRDMTPGNPRKTNGSRDEPLPGQVGWKRPGRKNGRSELHQQYIDRKAVEDAERAQKAQPGPANGTAEGDIPY